ALRSRPGPNRPCTDKTLVALARGGHTSAMNSAPPKFTMTQGLIVVVASIGFLFDTYELLMTPLTAPAAIAELLRVPLNNPLVTAWVGKLLWMTALCGGIFGLLGGWLTDKLG